MQTPPLRLAIAIDEASLDERYRAMRQREQAAREIDTFTVHGKTKACLAHPYLWLIPIAAVVVWGVMLVGKA